MAGQKNNVSAAWNRTPLPPSKTQVLITAPENWVTGASCLGAKVRWHVYGTLTGHAYFDTTAFDMEVPTVSTNADERQFVHRLCPAASFFLPWR
jgi:hypothetical protein